MPRPHFTVQGGTRVQPRHETTNAADTTGDCPSCKQKSAEIERLRRELAQGETRSRRPGGSTKSAGSAMMWAALGICAACLVFALFAIMRHG